MIHDFYRMKREGEKIAWLTSYDYPTAQFAEAAGMDMILVGDSLGMCVYGYESTWPVTMAQCIVHCEAVPPEVAGLITRKLSIPVLSIGAGMHCDGQLLIVSDLIGQFQTFTPKFVKKYANVAETITNAMKEYIQDLKAGTFPADEHSYHMIKGEEEKFQDLIKEYES